MKLAELKIMYVVFLTDIDCDTGLVCQMSPVAYTENEHYAKLFTGLCNKEDDEFPLRKYDYKKL